MLSLMTCHARIRKFYCLTDLRSVFVCVVAISSFKLKTMPRIFVQIDHLNLFLHFYQYPKIVLGQKKTKLIEAVCGLLQGAV